METEREEIAAGTPRAKEAEKRQAERKAAKSPRKGRLGLRGEGERRGPGGFM